MPKCEDCGNTSNFIITYIEFDTVKYQDGKVIDEYAGERNRYDNEYPPACAECDSIFIEGVEDM